MCINIVFTLPDCVEYPLVNATIGTLPHIMPTLYIIATPIGNLEDLSFRAVRILGEIDILACEDTRRTRILLDRYQIPTPQKIISYREGNEKNAGNGILKLIDEGKSVGLVSDAGYPGLSDPGYRLVSEAVERGIKIDVIPGASAIDTALVASGLPSDSFTFLGFPPRKPISLRNFIGAEKESSHTLILFESPLRVDKFLEAAFEVLGDRKAAVCIELTKMFEAVHRGYLSDLLKEFTGKKIKGEVTIVVAGNNKKFMRREEDKE
jgi:16S rRNA (cytidine1402-2'-O)-methyltransferase